MCLPGVESFLSVPCLEVVFFSKKKIPVPFLPVHLCVHLPSLLKEQRMKVLRRTALEAVLLSVSNKVRTQIPNQGICRPCLSPDLGGLLMVWKGLNC